MWGYKIPRLKQFSAAKSYDMVDGGQTAIRVWHVGARWFSMKGSCMKEW